MNLKKIIILPAGFILIHVLYIGCCKCLEGTFHRELTGIRSSEYGDSRYFNRDTVLVLDTLNISLNLQYKLISQSVQNPMRGFVNSASALSCNCSAYNDLGFKFPLDSITISSDHNYKAIPAGQNLGTQFSAIFQSYDSATGNAHSSILSLTALTDSLNAVKRSDGIFLFSKPGTPPEKDHHFTYNLFSNGQRFSYTSPRFIRWE